jgi:endonuclease G, mitochondrial
MAYDAGINSESFLMSNMSPQLHEFNAGIWEEMEAQVRVWAKRYGQVYIVTGPIFREPMPRIGKASRVAVPPAFYKVLIRQEASGLQAIGFRLPHKASSAKLDGFACSVAELEAETGLRFFPLLPSTIAERVKGTYDLSKWPIKRNKGKAKGPGRRPKPPVGK